MRAGDQALMQAGAERGFAGLARADDSKAMLGPLMHWCLGLIF